MRDGDRGRVPALSTLGPREKLWCALADLYLDTDVSLFVDHIVRTAREQGFGVDAVEHALRFEVRPAFWPQNFNVAGEWAGWPDEYVTELVSRAIARPPLFCRGPFRRWCRDWFMPDEWPAIRAGLARTDMTRSS